MKNPSMCASLLEKLLSSELLVLADLYACQKTMYECVLVRDWVALQSATSASHLLVNSFLEHESRRIALLQEELPGIEGTKDFYQITAFFGEKERIHINSLFREMKRLLLLSKTENDVFNTYITNARTIVSGMLETILPARRNKIYTRRGSLAAACVENLVVNRSY